MTLKNITYFGKESNSYDNLQKMKEEQCKVITTIDKVDREVNKKLIGYLAEELTK